MSSEPKKRNKQTIFFAASAILHVLVLLLATWLGRYSGWEYWDQKKSSSNQAMGPLPPPGPSPKFVVKRVDKTKYLKNQIVNSNSSPTSPQEAPQTRFLGKENNKVDKQTVSKRIGTFNEGKLKGKKDQANRLDEKKVVQTPGVTPNTQSHPTHPTTQEKNDLKSKKVKLSDLGIGAFSGLVADKKKNTQENQKFESRVAGMAPGQKTSGQDGDRNSPAQSSDFIDDVALGEITSLNTVEFQYFGFYDRVRKKIEQHWNNSIKARAYSLYRKGELRDGNYITSLRVVMNQFGTIVNVVVLGASGSQELDDAAIESFNRAGPFPNPPQGMIKDGKVTIEWGFVVKG